MAKGDKHLGITINSELHGKLVYISEYEGRSMNGELLFLIRKAVEWSIGVIFRNPKREER